MKPATFTSYICARRAELALGWASGSSFENFAQVILDDIVRKHLSDKIGLDTTANPARLVQDDGNDINKASWPSMREIKYPFKTPAHNNPHKKTAKIADFMIKNNRFVYDAVNHNWTLKSTKYYIELKCESPDTGAFGGMSFNDAWAVDYKKIKEAAQYELDQQATTAGFRRRYWAVTLAFSPARVAKLKSLIWTSEQTAQGDPELFVGLDEITN